MERLSKLEIEKKFVEKILKLTKKEIALLSEYLVDNDTEISSLISSLGVDIREQRKWLGEVKKEINGEIVKDLQSSQKFEKQKRKKELVK